MAFVKATKQQAKLRLAIFGPSGSGKTFTSLRIAKGMGGKVAVIDTEERSAIKYADRFDFDVCELADKSIESCCNTIKEAAAGGYSVIIIDSLSHAWQELLQQIDKLAATKFKGNSWGAWSEGTPKQKNLVETILKCPAHIIATMRSKTEWVQEQGNNGKTKPVKVGLAPEQGKGIEYEFDMLMEITTDHLATVSKDRTGKFQDQVIEKPGEEFGAALMAWLGQGEAPPTPEPIVVQSEEEFLAELDMTLGDRGVVGDGAAKAKAKILGLAKVADLADLKPAWRTALLKAINAGKYDEFKMNGTAVAAQ
jgi:nucleoside-triphosphatase THEP1